MYYHAKVPCRRCPLPRPQQEIEEEQRLRERAANSNRRRLSGRSDGVFLWRSLARCHCFLACHWCYKTENHGRKEGTGSFSRQRDKKVLIMWEHDSCTAGDMRWRFDARRCFLPKNVKEPYQFWFFVMLYNAMQPKLIRLTGMLPRTVSRVDTFLDTKVQM